MTFLMTEQFGDPVLEGLNPQPVQSLVRNAEVSTTLVKGNIVHLDMRDNRASTTDDGLMPKDPSGGWVNVRTLGASALGTILDRKHAAFCVIEEEILPGETGLVTWAGMTVVKLGSQTTIATTDPLDPFTIDFSELRGEMLVAAGDRKLGISLERGITVGDGVVTAIPNDVKVYFNGLATDYIP